MFEAIGRVCQDYYNDLPSDVLLKVGKSGLYSFTATFMFLHDGIKTAPVTHFNLRDPLSAAAITALASLIHGLTTPIFNKIFGNNELKLHQELIKNLVVSSLTFVLISYITTSKVNLLSVKKFPMVSVNLFRTILNIQPVFLDWVDANFPNVGFHETAECYRTVFRWVGLNMEPGGLSSVYISNYWA